MTNCESKKKYAFFVEGETEVLGLKKAFGIKARKIGIYGHTSTVDHIFKKLKAAIQLNEYTHVFVMFDRESRTETSKELKHELEAKLIKEFPNLTVNVAIPDFDIESWLFSDTEITEKYFGQKMSKKAKFEGRNGCKSLKEYMPKADYDKTTDGVTLFSKVRWSKICSNSPSARISNIEKSFPDCGWLAT
ncbi:DUF4276 family protein [Brevundimonas pishanensis]|uniref:DUF4276 family protein n=1 Tax=Brevundimonas pishanensis TaxID=2896315 RepID=UPI001FA7D1F6|nr:DUF4276 family protein [Brevundimonas pishanensis]